MKKILLTILLIILSTLVLISCGDSTKKHSDGDDTEQTDEVKTDSPFKIPEKSARDFVVDYMYEMADVKWSPANDIDTTDIHKSLYYNKGEIYYGLPYINLSTDADLDDFINDMVWDEEKQMYIYETATNRDNTKGNDCSSSILLAYKRFDNGAITAYDTASCFPLGDKSGIYPIGDIVVNGSEKQTDTITNNTEEQVHFEAFALLQKGDSVIWKTEGPGHIRMVLEVNVERNNAGKINGRRSYVKTIEQTNQFDTTNKERKTTWWIEHSYSFADLREKFYIPVTCKALSEERPEPNIEVVGANSKKTIAKAKSLLGNIKSNYELISAEIFIKDKDGNVIYTEKYKLPNNKMTNMIELKVFKFDFDMASLAEGDYTYSITAETVCGKGEIYNIEFTKKAE